MYVRVDGNEHTRLTGCEINRSTVEFSRWQAKRSTKCVAGTQCERGFISSEEPEWTEALREVSDRRVSRAWKGKDIY